MSDKKCLYLWMRMPYFHGYFAFIKKPRINSKGMDTSAIMGFMNALMDVIKRKPDHLAVAFDKEVLQEQKCTKNIKHIVMKRLETVVSLFRISRFTAKCIFRL
jgi:hypothetical protein